MNGEFEKWAKQSQVSVASYANLIDGINITDIQNNIDALFDGGNGMSRSQARLFLGVDSNNNVIDGQGFEILNDTFFGPQGSGLALTVLRSRETDKITFAVRGTEIEPLDINDIAADVDILLFGLAAEQLVELYNYYNRIIAPPNTTVTQYEVVPTPLSFGLQVSGTASAISISGINSSTQFDIAGHSLGGHLAAAFSRIFPNNVDQAFTFNAPGFDPLGSTAQTENLFSVFSSLGESVTPDFDQNKITTIVGEFGPSIIADLGTPPSPQQIIFAEKNTHSSIALSDTLSVYSLFERIDQTLDEETTQRILESSSNVAGLSLERSINFLGNLFFNDGISVDEGNRELFYERFAELEFHFDTNNFQNLSVININSLSVDQIQLQAEQLIEYRYALQELQTFVILDGGENIYSIHNLNGELDLENFSDQYLQDRAEFLVLNVNIGVNDTLRNNTDFPENVYIDIASGTEIFNRLDSVPSDDPRYIFGSNASDALIEGLRGDDHIFGGGGTDLLLGNIGDDIIEGGLGEDFLIGGQGEDQLFGGIGLRNGIAGIDEEQDQLFGGAGADKYYVGDTDRILDDRDGLGQVFFNGVELTGGSFVSEGEYQGGGFTYLVNGSELTVQDTAGNSISILGFRKDENGYLGITLTGDIAPDQNNPIVVGTGVVPSTGSTEYIDRRQDGINRENDRSYIYEAALYELNVPDDNGDAQPYYFEGANENDLLVGSVFPNATIFFDIGETLNGRDGDDILRGVDIVNGSLNDSELDDRDYLIGGRGNDFLYGYGGSDYLIGWDDSVISYGLLGIDLPFTPIEQRQNIGDEDFLYGGGGRDFLIAGYGNDLLDGGDDVDTIYANVGDDILIGGVGNDNLFADAYTALSPTLEEILMPPLPENIVYLYDYNQDNNIPSIQETFNDIVDAGEGNDFVVADRGDDLVFAGSGDDLVSGDRINTKLANQLIVVDLSTGGRRTLTIDELDRIYVDLDGEQHGTDTIFAGDGVDIVLGNGGNDFIYGEEGNDQLFGDDYVLEAEFHGDDTLDGGSGDDQLIGGGGNDSLTGGDGSDTLLGDELGFDTIFIFGQEIPSGPPTAIVIANDPATGRFDVEFEFVQFIPIDYQGDDQLFGGAGEDILRGDGGDDYLDGGSEADTLRGGIGVDTLIGGAGNDDLDGGSGDDIYIFNFGDGNETLSDNDIGEIRFTTSITSITQDGSDTTINYGSSDSLVLTGDIIRQVNNISVLGSSIDLVSFLDSSVTDLAATGGNDNIDLSNFDQINFVNAGAGDDVIQANVAGSYTLSGDQGDDTYFVSALRQDLTISLDDDTNGNDLIALEAGFDLSNIAITRDSASLFITLVDPANDTFDLSNSTSIKIEDYFADSLNFTGIQLAGGTLINEASVLANLQYIGDDANNTLIGTDGDDVFIGNGGDDFYSARAGNNSYIYLAGDGNDIINHSGSSAGTNTLELRNIAASSVSITRNDNNLKINLSDGSVITVNNHFSNAEFELDQIKFDDGSLLTATDILAAILSGSNQSDTIVATDGDDIVTGGEGDDLLVGGLGNDTYRYALGDGNDTIQDEGGVDTIEFQTGIQQADVSTFRNGEDLIVNIDTGSGATNSITVKEHYRNNQATLENLQFSDGTIVNAETVSGFIFDSFYDSLSIDISALPRNIEFNGFRDFDWFYGSTGSDVVLFSEEIESFLSEQVGVIRTGQGDDVIVSSTGGFLDSGLGDDYIYAGRDNDVIYGGPRDQTFNTHSDLSSYGGLPFPDQDINGLYPEDGEDVLFGESGNDYIQGGMGDDLIVGGHGDDEVSGGDGDDVYLFNFGDDSDRVIARESDYYQFSDRGQDGDFTNDNDVIRLGAGITVDDIVAEQLNDDLVIRFRHTLDSITVENYFSSDISLREAIKQIIFADGTQLLDADINTKIAEGLQVASTTTLDEASGASSLDGSADDNILVGNTSDNTIQGLDGNDGLYGSQGNDILIGGEGRDFIHGGEGDDRLIGGSGDDYLIGGNQSDTYFFSAGFGQDIIDNYDDTVVNSSSLGNFATDVIEFDTGIDSTDVSLQQSGDDLIVNHGNDSVLVKNHFLGLGLGLNQRYGIDSIQFADGTIWSSSFINANSGVTNTAPISINDTAILTRDSAGIFQPLVINPLINDSDIDNDSLNITSVELQGTSGSIQVDNNQIIFNAGNDFDSLTDADLEIALINYTISDIAGNTSDSVITVSISGALNLYQGTTQDDVITVNDAFGTFVDTGAGNDDVTIATDAAVNINLGAGNDTINFVSHNQGQANANTFNSNVSLGSGDNTATIDSNSRGSVRFLNNNLNLVDRGDNTLVINGDAVYRLGFGSLLITDGNLDIFIEGIEKDNILGGTRLFNTFVLNNETLTFEQLVTRGFDLDGTNEDDLLEGGNLVDRISGFEGKDSIIGNEGNDTLNGGFGDDAYLFNIGDGQDEVIDLSGSDAFVFGEGINPSILTATRNSNDLYIRYTNEDSVTISGWFDSLTNQIEYFSFFDGTYLSASEFNFSPTLDDSIADQIINQGDTFNLVLPSDLFSDIDPEDSLELSARTSDEQPLPQWLSFDTTTGIFSGIPLVDDVGLIEIKLYASDNNNASVFDVFTIDVLPTTNNPPIVANTIVDQITDEDTAFSFAVPVNTFDEVDVGDTLTYSATLTDGSALPTWLSFDATTQTFSGTPLNDDVGTVSIRVTATDTSNESIFDEFDLTVNNINDAPTVSNAIADQTTDEDAAFSFAVPVNTFDEVDVGDTLTYSATLTDGSALPTWLSFDATTQTFSGTPLNDDVGTVSVRVTATDSSSASVFDDFDLTVNEASNLNLIEGDNQNNTLIGTSAADRILGFGGDDTLRGRQENDELFGGDGNDNLFGEVGDDLLDGGAGDDTLRGASGNDTLLGGEGNDNLFGDAQNDTLEGGAGDDTLRGASGNDTLLGGEGDDNLFGDAQNDTLEGGAGDDTLRGASGIDILRGDEGNDNLFGDAQNDTLEGGIGIDTLDAGSGNDILRGGEGNDTLLARSGNDTLVGGTGDDRLEGSSGNDIYQLNRNDGFDSILDTSGGADAIQYGAGITNNDVWFVQNGNDLDVYTLGSNDRVQIDNWFTQNSRRIEEFQTESGAVLFDEDVQTLVDAMAAFGAPTNGEVSLTPTEEQQIQTLIAATWG